MHPNHPHGHSGHPPILGMNVSGNRARRGEVPFAILSLLKECDMHGYQIIQQASERTGGAWSPSPGSIYPALQALEEQGMIASSNVGGKRVFSLTELGRKHADMLPAEGPWAELASEPDPSRAVREASHSLLSAVTQIARVGAPEQVGRTVEILNDARKRIYAMLAGE